MKASNDQIIESYSRLGNIWLVGKELGVSGQSVQERLIKLGIERNNKPFSAEEDARLIKDYNTYLLAGKLQCLADEMGRTRQFICRKAKKLGLTDRNRSPKLVATYKPSKSKGYWDGKVHPRGMAGKHHSQKTKDRLTITSTAMMLKISADTERRAAMNKKIIMTRHSKGGYSPGRQNTSWKAGWREIGGKRKYFRSRWEANYARYLEFLKQHGEILEWEHECDVFWFDGIKRGCMSYLPDFKVMQSDSKIEYHEVKGWMDDRSKTKINRMRIYHPYVVLRIIDGSWFKRENKKLSGLIKDWE